MMRVKAEKNIGADEIAGFVQEKTDDSFICFLSSDISVVMILSLFIDKKQSPVSEGGTVRGQMKG